MMLNSGEDGAALDVLSRIEIDSGAVSRRGLEVSTPVYMGPSEDAEQLFPLCTNASSIILSLSFLLSWLRKLVLGELNEYDDEVDVDLDDIDDSFVGETGRESASLISSSMRSRLGLPGMPHGAERFVGDGVRVRRSGSV